MVWTIVPQLWLRNWMFLIAIVMRVTWFRSSFELLPRCGSAQRIPLRLAWCCTSILKYLNFVQICLQSEIGCDCLYVCYPDVCWILSSLNWNSPNWLHWEPSNLCWGIDGVRPLNSALVLDLKLFVVVSQRPDTTIILHLHLTPFVTLPMTCATDLLAGSSSSKNSSTIGFLSG